VREAVRERERERERESELLIVFIRLLAWFFSVLSQSLSEEGLLNLGPTVEIMAEVEGLEAHKQAVTKRLNSIRS